MEEKKKCPCCGRHCDLDDLHCGRGREYLHTGVIPEGGHRGEHHHGEGPEGGHRGEHPHGCGPASIRKTEKYRNMDVSNKLVMNLRDLGHVIRFLFEGKGSQKRILIILLETGKLTQRALTERLRIKPGSASEVIGKLESAGLITRTLSQQDRRTADIELTEAGRQRAEAALREREIRHQEMFSCLTEEEKNTLLSLAEKLNEDWERRYREDGRGDGGRR